MGLYSLIMLLFNLTLIAAYVYAVIAAFLLLLDNRDSSSTFAWILILLFLPIIGVALYYLTGQNWRRNAKRIRLEGYFFDKHLKKVLKSVMKSQKSEILKLKDFEKKSFDKKMLKLLYNNSNSLLTTKNSVKIFVKGEDKFESLIRDLKNAEKFIHLEYYIFRSDALTKKIKQILIDKAKAGVEVRIISDSMGSFFLGKKFRFDLKRAGAKVEEYDNFLYFSKFHTINYRNHRKIAIIDGKIGYTGGMNMGKEYVDGGKQFSSWRDTHMRIDGEAVKILQAVFSMSWYFTTEEKLFTSKYYPIFKRMRKKVPLQITTSGPDSEWESIEQLYFSLINVAKKEVLIQTPYFIPTASLATALKTAALSGVKVKLMVAGVTNQRLPYRAAFTYFKDLMKAGVKVYHYNKGFMHSKSIVVDSKICSVGSANMDVRSLKLNYELNVLMYEDRLSRQLKKQFNVDLKECKEFTIEDHDKFSLMRKLGNSLSRLMAPLL